VNKNSIYIFGIVVVVVLGVGGFVWYRQYRQSSSMEGLEVAPTSAPAEVSSGSSSATTEEEVKEFDIVGSNFKFDPQTITVKKGDRVKIIFKSVGGMHDFVLDDFDVSTETLSDGEEETVEFTADTAGAFEYYCSIGNHRAVGMKGGFVVE